MEGNHNTPVDSGSPLQCPQWIELPDLVLELIFEKLDFRNHFNNIESKRTLLNCRAVHTKWKISMDRVLERKSLEKYTKWDPDIPDYSPNTMETFPYLQLISSSKLSMAACNPKIYSGNYVGCPFPTKSVYLGFNPRRRFSEGDTLIRVENFFSKTGHFLNSTTISGITVTPQIFESILKNTPNLQAIELDSITFAKEYFQNVALTIDPLLAPLPKLKYIRVADLRTPLNSEDMFDDFHDVYTWLLSPYARSLTSLHSDVFNEWSGGNESIGPFPYRKRTPLRLPQFPMLKQVKFMEDFDWIIFSKAENYNVFSNLETISFDTFKDDKELKVLLRFIGNFTNTLTNLQFDFKRSWSYGQRSQPLCWAVEERNDEDFSLSFPHMRTLGIFYPHDEQELGLLKQFLQLFPNLTKLKLLRFQKGCCSDTETEPEFRIKVSQYIERKLNNNGIEQQILTLCPNLKKLTVSLNDIDESLVYTKSF